MEVNEEKMKLIDYLCEKKEMIINLLELLSVEVKGKYGKTLFDVLREFFVERDQISESNKKKWDLFKEMFWKYLIRLTIVGTLITIVVILSIIYYLFEQFKTGDLKILP